MNLLFETLLFALLYMQPAPGPFDKFYSDFKNSTTLTYSATFKASNKSTTGILAEGRVFIEKKDFNIMKYRSFAISEMSLLEKVTFDDVLYDGENAYMLDNKEGTYINRGQWNENGKKYSGSSILFRDLFTIVQLFEKEKATIIYTSDEKGFQFRLPADASRGDVIMDFRNGDRLPYRVTKNEKNSTNYVVLSIDGVRVDVSFPPAFFRPQKGVVMKDGAEKIAPQSAVHVKSAPSWKLTNPNEQNRGQ